MTKRVAVLLVAMGMLSGLGMPLRRPCCSLARLASSVSSPDCCPMPECCRGEKRGAAPIVLSPASAGPSAPALLSGPFPALEPRATLPAAGSPIGEIASLHGPPGATRSLSILLSTLRV